MKVKDCFYVRVKMAATEAKLSSISGNMSLVLEKSEFPHAILRLKNLAAKKTVQDKLTNSGLFSQVTFLKNFNIEE